MPRAGGRAKTRLVAQDRQRAQPPDQRCVAHLGQERIPDQERRFGHFAISRRAKSAAAA